MQNKINSLLPERVHQIITETMKKVVQAALIGSEFTTDDQSRSEQHLSLQERDRSADETLNRYKKIARSRRSRHWSRRKFFARSSGLSAAYFH